MSTVKDAQEKVLKHLINRGKGTEFGEKHSFSDINSLSDFKKNVPICFYKDLELYINKMKEGESNILWPGIITKYAVSAGTSGKGKHIPLSKERFKSDQKFMRRVALNYLSHPKNIFSVLGSHVSLPGNIDSLKSNSNVQLGEISAFLAKESPLWLSMFQIRSPEEMIREKWADKFERCLDKAIESNIKQITAVPSWALRFFQRALEKTGKDSIKEVWPNLKLLICGGEDIKTYMPHFKYLCRGLNMNYIENYGASEGYFAFSDDRERDDLRLIVDNGLFFEWIPNPKYSEEEMVKQETIPTWKVEKSVPYGLIVTNNSGLWRYCVNDIIEFTDTETPRIMVRGRTSEMLDKFGESIEGYQAEEAMEKTAKQLNAEFSAFMMGGILDDHREVPFHIWFIQWVKKPDNMEEFSVNLDRNLRDINRRYAIRREGNTIDNLKLYDLNQDILHLWKEKTMQTGAQTKVPRIITDDDKIKCLKALCDENPKVILD
ncbi:MAG: GH3 auxin-responsive promoter family protein [Balneolales bacterium]